MLPANLNMDYTNKDYEAFRSMMLEQLSILMPEYTDHSQTDAGIVIIELLARGLDILSYYQDVNIGETYLATQEQLENALKWCDMLGYTPRPATPSRYRNQVFVLSAIQDTPVVIPAGTVVKTPDSVLEESVKFETVEDLIIPEGSLGNEQDLENNYLYSVEIVQGESITGESLGTSNLTANQRFELMYSPAIVEDILLLINEGGGFEPWEKVETFNDSTSVSKHYRVSLNNEGKATIIFGDGVSGKIPLTITNGIFADYRIGGGEQGNLGAFKITELDSNISEVEETFNPDSPDVLGLDSETLSDIKVNAPNSFRTKWSCLTTEDYAERLLEVFPQVKFANSIQDPDDIDGVKIYLLLKDNKPLTPELLGEINAMFEERKLLGTNISSVELPVFTPVDISADLLLRERAIKVDAEHVVGEVLDDFFSIGNYDFNAPLSITELESLVSESVEGALSFRITTPSDLVVIPSDDEILTLGTVVINTVGGV